MAILSNTEFGILRLTISRAQKRNSINAEMFDTMTEALSRAASDDAVRVVLLQGGEQIFSAGADLEEMRSQPEVLDRAMTNFFAALRAFPKPVVAQVMGPCVGDALSMLLYCDLVYASERALFSLPCVALGQTTRFGSAFVMAAAAGGEVTFDHLLVNGFSHFLALFELLFMRAKRALNLAEKRDGAGTGLVEEKSRVVERADVFVGVVQKVAVGAAGGGAGAGHVVLALFVGGVGEIHGVAEFAAELRAARPVDDAREDTDEDDADDGADQEDVGDIPFAVVGHFAGTCL